MRKFVDDREDMQQIVKGLQSQGKKVVFTNGVFDLLHVGHIRSLKDARSRGDYLLVAVNTDESTRALKGPDLPVNPFNERVEVLCALDFIDYITPLKEKTADVLLSELHPNIHAKGTDYTPETVPERETVLSYGGSIAIVGDPKDHSTTRMIERIGRISRSKTAKGKKAGKPSAKKEEGRAVKPAKAGKTKTKKATKKKTTGASRTASKSVKRAGLKKKAVGKAKKTGARAAPASKGKKSAKPASTKPKTAAARKGVKKTGKMRTMGAG